MQNKSPMIRLLLPYEDEKVFIREYPAFCDAGLLFLPTRRQFSPGDPVRFELVTADRKRLLMGEGKVAGTPLPNRIGVMVRPERMESGSRAIYEKLCEAIAARKAEEGPPDAAEQDKEENIKEPEEEGEREAEDRVEEKEEVDKEEGIKEPEKQEMEEDKEEDKEEELKEQETLQHGVEENEDRIEKAENGDEAERAGQKAHDIEDIQCIIGLDFGTERIRASAVVDGELKKIGFGDEEDFFPSGVAFGQKRILFGNEAISRRRTQPQRSLFAIKQIIGQRFISDTVKEIQEQVPVSFVPDERGYTAVWLADEKPSITEICSGILKEVRINSQEKLGICCRGIVLGVPSSFTMNQRKEIIKSARKAGFHHIRLFSESSALALSYTAGQKLAAKRLFILDIGAGFLDISILNVTGDDFDVIGRTGIMLQKEADIDGCIIRHVMKRIEISGHLSTDLVEREKFREAVESAARALDIRNSCRLNAKGVLRDFSGDVQDLDIELGREELDEFFTNWTGLIMNLCSSLLAENNLSPDRIDQIVFSGGRSAIPAIKKALEKFFGVKPFRVADRENAVASGLAMLGDSIATDRGSGGPLYRFKDVLGTSLGLGAGILKNGNNDSKIEITSIIDRNTALPCKRNIVMNIPENFGEYVEVSIFQGTEISGVLEAGACLEYQGTLRIMKPIMQAGENAVLRIHFVLDENAMISFDVLDETRDETCNFSWIHFDSPEDLYESIEQNRMVTCDPGLFRKS